MLGLQGGVLAWGAQKLSGVTVAERWALDYLVIQESSQAREATVVKEDQRVQQVLVVPEVEEGGGSVRKLIVRVRLWLGEHDLVDSSDILQEEEDNILASKQEAREQPEKPPEASSPGIKSL